MKISYSWLSDYIKTDLSPQEMAEILTQTGLEVEGIEEVESVPGGLKGLVVGEVMSKEQHPNADRLSVTTVDVGGDELLPIVCGAPNVAKGQKVIVATVGTTLFPTSGDSFKIKKGKIRGEVSNGMICAEDEIGLGTSHDGILVLDENAEIGIPASEYFELSSDFCIEIGLTPNRTDGMSHIGVARDLMAALHNMEGIKNDADARVIWPDNSGFQEGEKEPFAVEIQNAEDCPRYAGLLIEGIEVKPSPEWMQRKLKCIGLTPINNVVDITNYVLHEYGQPLHAFDADKIAGDKVVVRNLNQGTEFTTLDEEVRKLDAKDLMICNGDSDLDKSGMCIAGVFGGIHSGVTDQTKRVFLESAYFNPVSIRKTSKRHGLNTDASFRFERGIDPNITVEALQRAALLIQELGGGQVATKISDSRPEPDPHFEVKFNTDSVERLIGQKISDEKIQSIFTDLDIEVISENENNWIVAVPPYRVDVQREADLVEEIIRIYGYNNIAIPEKMTSSLSYALSPDPEVVQNRVSDILSNNGFLEMMSNSLSKEEYATKYANQIVAPQDSVKILNPLSKDLNSMRQTLIYGGLEAILKNQNYKSADLKLYEFGKEYRLINGEYNERRKLTLFITGKRAPENWNREEDEFTYFDLKASVESILIGLGLFTNPTDSKLENDFFGDGVVLSVQNKALASMGNIDVKLLNDFGIKNQVWCADLDWDMIMELMKRVQTKHKEIVKFPSSRRDLSLLLDNQVPFSDIASIARKSEKKLLKNVGLFDVYEGKNLPDGKKSYAVSFVFQDENKTLTDKQVDKIMANIQRNLESQINAQLR